MTIESRIIPEPTLFFGNNKSTIDPKVGLLNYGPFSLSSVSDVPHFNIKTGVIASEKSLELLRDWLERLSYRIEGADIPDSNVRGIDFPGLSKVSPFRLELVIDDSWVETISKADISKALEHPSRKQRIINVFEIYKQKFDDLSGDQPNPNIVLLPIDNEVMAKCKDNRYEVEKIIYERRTFDKSKPWVEVPLFDFHHAMKVIAHKYGMVSQIIRPKTLRFSPDIQDPATIGWNFAVATYYKGTGTPWKLADIDEDTCYVGISFYEDLSKAKRTMRTSMAHVYLRTGESQIIRGRSFHWDDSKGKTPILSSEHAEQIMDDVVSLYKRQKGKKPRRVVIHKSSEFVSDEKQGFDYALQDVELSDYVHISKKVDVRAYPVGYPFPALRGTMLGKNDRWFLYTSGYIPSFGTYPGSTIPRPLMINIDKCDTTPSQICKDILALSKLDWNSADFCKREPVTLSVSRKVGSILAEMDENDVKDPPQGYRYYM